MTVDADAERIDVLVVTAEELVTALEARRRMDRDPVLRVTPPFSGRMRARLHEVADQSGSDPVLLLVPPEALVTSAPPYPDTRATADRLRANPDVEYSVDRHHRQHRQAVREWRAAVPETVPDRVSLSTAGGALEADLRVLDADWPPHETD